MAFNWSKAIDQGAGVSNNGDELGQGQRGLFGWDMEHKRGLSTQDIRKSLSSNCSYEFPRGAFGGIGNAILNGWQMNGIVTLSDGSAIGVEDETDEQDDRFDDNESLRPDLAPGASNNPIEGTTAGCAGVAAGQKLGTPELYYDPCAFIPSLPGFFGNLARNSLTAPGIATFDWSVVKNFAISETSQLQFRAEFFNLFNRPNFRNPTVELFRSSSTRANPRYDSDVGGFGPDGTGTHQIDETRTSARQVQFGLRFIY